LSNMLARIPKGNAEMVLALIRTIWSQPDPAAVRALLYEVVARLEPRFPAVPAGSFAETIGPTPPIARSREALPASIISPIS
jgi:hypothetical protein